MTNPTAKEIFEMSKKASRWQGVKDVYPYPFSVRICNALRRAGYGIEGERYQLNEAEVRRMVLNGDIWYVNHIGPKSIYELCKWMAEEDAK